VSALDRIRARLGLDPVQKAAEPEPEEWSDVAKAAPDTSCPVEDRQEELEVFGWKAISAPDGEVWMTHPTITGALTVDEAWNLATADD